MWLEHESDEKGGEWQKSEMRRGIRRDAHGGTKAKRRATPFRASFPRHDCAMRPRHRMRPYYNAPVPRELLLRVATALALPVEPLLAFEGQAIRAFYSQAFCGGAVFRMSNGAGATQARVPMVFQSALSGVMLAAETVAHASVLKKVPPPVTTTTNLLRPLAPYLSLDRKKDWEAGCICQDSDYVAAYQEKWSRCAEPVATTPKS